ncbi:MAG: peptidoglycan editing factor PgeF [Lachnospiraceae bacterium]
MSRIDTVVIENRINRHTSLLRKEIPSAAPFLSFSSFEKLPFLRHGFSTRLGGVSEGAFTSLNLGFRRGDLDENVRENYRRICCSMEIPMESLVFTDQIHETTIRRVTSDDCGKGIFRERDYSGVDGLLTDEPFVTLVVFGADCVPVFFADVKKHVIGVAHAGWRGTVAGISAAMVKRLAEEFGSDANDLSVVIGPSICKDCYEVSEDVAERFMESYPSLVPKAVFKSKNIEGKYQLDLWEMNRQILIEAGVPKEQIEVSGVCTCCHKELLYSHRVMGNERGSLAGFLMLERKQK